MKSIIDIFIFLIMLPSILLGEIILKFFSTETVSTILENKYDWKEEKIYNLYIIIGIIIWYLMFTLWS